MSMILKNVRLSYLNAFTPRPADSSDPASKMRYSVSLVIPKDHPQIDEVKKAIAAAAETKFGEKAKAILKKKPTLRDGDEDREDDPVYSGCFFIGAASTRKPQVVDRRMNLITGEEEAFSGCYGNVSVNFYGYDVGTNKGVACGLNNIQITKNDPDLRLGGAPNADEEFDSLDDDDDEDDVLA